MALGVQTYISGKLLVPALQLLHHKVNIEVIYTVALLGTTEDHSILFYISLSH